MTGFRAAPDSYRPISLACSKVLILYFTYCLMLAVDIKAANVVVMANSAKCKNPSDLYIDVNNQIVYSACAQTGIVAIKGFDISTLADSTQCSNARSVYGDPLQGLLYAACDDGLIAINMNGSSVTKMAASSQCPSPRKLYADASNSVLYAACYDGGVIAINGSSITTVASSSQCPNPADVFVSSNGVIYAACYYGGVIAINGSSVTNLTTPSQCPNPIDLYVDSMTIFAACHNGAVISIVGSVITTEFDWCQKPNAIWYYNNRVYTACNGEYFKTSTGIVTSARANNGVSTFATKAQCPNATSVFAINNVVYTACNSFNVDDWSGVIATVLEYSPRPTVTSVSGACTTSGNNLVNCPVSGGGTITINGQNFKHLSNKVTANICNGAVTVVSSSLAHCTLASGLDGAKFVVTMTFGIEPTFSTDAPSIAYSSSFTYTTVLTTDDCPRPSAVHASPDDWFFALCDNRLTFFDYTDPKTHIKDSLSSDRCLSMYAYSSINENSSTSYISYGACSSGLAIFNITKGSSSLDISGKFPNSTAVYFDTSNDVIYVAYDGKVVASNGSSVKNLTTQSQCPNPIDLYVVSSKDATIVYAACLDGGVIAINVSDSSVTNIATQSQCSKPRGVHAYVDSSKSVVVYAACLNGGVIAIRGSSVATVATSLQCPMPRNVYVNPSNGVIIAVCFNGGVISISGSAVTTVAPSSQCQNPVDVFVRPSNGHILAACFNGIISISPSLPSDSSSSSSSSSTGSSSIPSSASSSKIVSYYYMIILLIAGFSLYLI